MKKALERDWRERWQRNFDEAQANRQRRATPADNPVFGPKALNKHKNLRKHESSLLTQVRTGKVGLKSLLV